MTEAIKVLRSAQVEFTEHCFQYQDKGGTAHSSFSLGVNEHQVIKTLIFVTQDQVPLVMLMHGDCQVDVKRLAQQLDVKRVRPIGAELAEKVTGYQVGGISPFGLREPLMICAESSIFAFEKIFINGGQRGFLVCLKTEDLDRVLNPLRVDVAVKK